MEFLEDNQICKWAEECGLLRGERFAVRLPELPSTFEQRLVEAWAEIHLEELRRDWDLLQSGQPPIKIEPLK